MVRKTRYSVAKPIPTISKDKLDNSKHVYATGFPLDATLDNIVEFFGNFGPTELVQMRRDSQYKFNGSCFVTYAKQKNAKTFVETPNVKFNGVEIIGRRPALPGQLEPGHLCYMKNDEKKKSKEETKINFEKQYDKREPGPVSLVQHNSQFIAYPTSSDSHSQLTAAPSSVQEMIRVEPDSPSNSTRQVAARNLSTISTLIQSQSSNAQIPDTLAATEKCRRFFELHLELAAAQNKIDLVRSLIQRLVDGFLVPEEFVDQMLSEFELPQNTTVVTLLKNILPFVRLLTSNKIKSDGIVPPPAAVAASRTRPALPNKDVTKNFDAQPDLMSFPQAALHEPQDPTAITNKDLVALQASFGSAVADSKKRKLHELSSDDDIIDHETLEGVNLLEESSKMYGDTGRVAKKVRIIPPDRPSPIDQLVHHIMQMSGNIEVLETDPVLLEFRNTVHNKEELEKVAIILVLQCLEDHPFIPSAVQLCCNLNDFEIDKVKLQLPFIDTFYSIYRQKDDLRKEQPPTKWIGCLTLLAESISKFRVEGILPMLALIDYFLNDIQLCLQNPASDEEVECAAHQLFYVGEVVCRFGYPGKLNAVKATVADAIVLGRGSEKARRELVEAYGRWDSSWTRK